jgi:hypothetical protein
MGSRLVFAGGGEEAGPKSPQPAVEEAREEQRRCQTCPSTLLKTAFHLFSLSRSAAPSVYLLATSVPRASMANHYGFSSPPIPAIPNAAISARCIFRSQPQACPRGGGLVRGRPAAHARHRLRDGNSRTRHGRWIHVRAFALSVGSVTLKY